MSYRAGFAGLIGLPNAGKSSLVNTLVGEKVGIVTRKPQTTRQRVLGLHTDDSSQIIFVDSPGLIKGEAGLNKFLKEEAEAVIQDSDALIAVLNIDQGSFEDLEAVVEKVAAAKKPWMVVITKTDLPQAHRVDILKGRLKDHEVPVVAGSAVKGAAGLKADILAHLPGLLPETSGPLYDPEIYTTQTLREMAAELVREKAFTHLHQEIPYGLAVQVKRFVEDEGPVVKIYADLVIAKENHRSILIGERGQMIRTIGAEARQDLERILDRKVYLELFVTVKRNWPQSEPFMKEMGYVVPEQRP